MPNDHPIHKMHSYNKSRWIMIHSHESLNRSYDAIAAEVGFSRERVRQYYNRGKQTMMRALRMPFDQFPLQPYQWIITIGWEYTFFKSRWAFYNLPGITDPRLFGMFDMSDIPWRQAAHEKRAIHPKTQISVPDDKYFLQAIDSGSNPGSCPHPALEDLIERWNRRAL